MGLCVIGLRVLAVSFVFAGANIAIQGVFQATEGGVQSLLVSLLRQLIFVLPAAWLFARCCRLACGWRSPSRKC